MLLYDKKLLMEELKKIKNAEPAAEIEDLKKLFLLLSGEKETVKQTTMEDIAYFFNNTSNIMHLYYDNLNDIFNRSKLIDYKSVNRRAV